MSSLGLKIKVRGRQLFGYQHFSKYLFLCSTDEWNSHWFGTTWWWV